jgi:hypothetical protein
MSVDRSALERRWVHSHEEDVPGEMVFRPATHDFPPSRGRLAFELRPDGSYAEAAIGPADVPLEVTGAWTLDGDVLVISRDAGSEPERKLRVKAAEPDRLVVATG